MVGIQKRKQEAYSHRVHALRFKVLDLFPQPIHIQFAPDLPASVHALSHPDTQVSWRQWLDLIHPQVVPVLLQTFSDFQQVSEAFRGDQANLRSLLFNERVGGDRGAVDDDLRLFQQAAGVHSHGRCQTQYSFEHTI